MTLFNRGNCGPKDSPPPTGGVGPVGAQDVAPSYLPKGVVTKGREAAEPGTARVPERLVKEACLKYKRGH